ncbi:MerR family transcriptional regulator [Murimonas intestini]|uniref:MerR family transcriptional regulator n=1 Tax=Murimonas intestini TaxID=1337051 RepID=UPI0011DC960D|nr:MerR family transcriptional regulator [Murimonas intestini]
MLSIGEFSNICQVSAKTLRYYAEIGLILPEEINPENGYRYYSIRQLETMLFINRLKSYSFSLEEIKAILHSKEPQEEKLCLELIRKKHLIEREKQELVKTLAQLDADITNLEQGKSMMSYMDNIDVQLTEVPPMYLLSVRKMVHENDFEEEYRNCFGEIFKKIIDRKLTAAAPPMVLFHSEDYTPLGMDTEFAIPVKEYATGTRDFKPGLCLKTVLNGPYSGLPSVYARQMEWAEKEGYKGHDALFEVYITDPSQVTNESGLITEVCYPVRKIKPLRKH